MSKEDFTSFDQFIQNCRVLLHENDLEIDSSNFVEPFSKLAQSIIDLSIIFISESYERQKFNDTIADDILNDQIIIFEWTAVVKKYFFLLQDSYIQINKARILEDEGKIKNRGFKKYYAECIKHLDDGLSELELNYKNRILQLSSNKKEKKVFANYVLHNNNPWPEYESQFIAIKAQINEIEERFIHFDDIAVHIKGVKNTILDNVSNCIFEIESINKTFVELNDFLGEIKLNDKVQLIKENMFHLEQEIQSKFHIEDFSENIELDIEYLEGEIKYPINTLEGKVLTLTISLKRRLLNWLKNKIYPNLSEIWGMIEVDQNGMKMMLHNLALVETQKSTLTDVELLDLKIKMEEIIIPFKRKIDKSAGIISSLIEKINVNIEKDFSLSLIYKTNQYFLFPEVSAKDMGNSVAQNQWVSKGIKFFSKQLEGLKIALLLHQKDRNLTYAERLVRYVNSRKINDIHSKYINLFTAKGYISDTFTVGLDSEISKIEDSINAWKSGFQGSVLISGGRLVGKTLLGEKVASRFFLNNSFRLNPEMTLKVGESTMEVKGDLLEALNFIRATAQLKCLIWIDDIELWNTPQTSLAQNIQALDDFVRFHSNSYFVMVAISSLTKNRSQAFGLIKNAFQTEISIGSYSFKDFHEALSIKHHSTHYQLVNNDGELISKSEMKSIIKRLYGLSHGIIGNGIHLWASRCIESGDSAVEYIYADYVTLPDFFDADMLVLLNAVHLKKRILESELEKLYGRRYSERYAIIVQKLLSVAVLVKTIDHWISINECMASDISLILSESKIN